jgi:hypothetical protein
MRAILEPEARQEAPPASRLADLAAPGLAGLLALLAWILDWRGGDLPSQIYRIGLFRSKGFALWDDQWYGGHHTIGYSLLLPVLGAVLGVALLGGLSAVVAAWAFDRLVRGWIGQRAMAASLWFAAGTVVNLAVGRLAFALGLAAGLVALLALVRRRPVVAATLAAATGLASPVAGAFLALAGGARVLAVWTDGRGDRQRRSIPALTMAVMAVLPVVFFAVVFPEGGTFPFTVGGLLAVLGSALAVWWSVDERSVRVGAVLYAVIGLGVFIVPTPLGGNLTRLGMMFAAPLVLCGLGRPRRLAGIALLGLLAWWQWSPALDSISGGAGRDPSASASYYTGLLTYLSSQPGPMRIEVPVTRHHWEVVRVAPRFGLARGWERQLDIADNQLFYHPGLEASTYLSWLRTNAVQYVALPDAALDRSSLAEASILRAGVGGLDPVWSDGDWQVWRVAGALPLASGSAHLVALDADSFTLLADRPGDVTVRVRYTVHWQVRGTVGCVGSSPDGWTVVRVLQPGRVSVHATLGGELITFGGQPASSCDAP